MASSKLGVVKKITKKFRQKAPTEESDSDVDEKTIQKVQPQKRSRKPLNLKPFPNLKDIAPAVESDSDEEDEIPLEKPNKRKRKLSNLGSAAAAVAADASAVVYLGRLPFGFFEEQMNGFFSQFGDVKRLRLSRNKRTGKSKHHAFIEFDNSDVSQVVADTMNNYLLFGHKLVCHVVSKAELHKGLFRGAEKKFVKMPWRRRMQHNKDKEPHQLEELSTRLVAREAKKQPRLTALGIDYDFSAVGYTAHQQPKAKKIKFT